MFGCQKNLFRTCIIGLLIGNVICLGQPKLDWDRSSFQHDVGNEICMGQRAHFWLDLINVGTEATQGRTTMEVIITPTGMFSDSVGVLCTDSNYAPIEPGETSRFYCSGVVPDLDPDRYWFAIWFPWYDWAWDQGEWYPGVPTNIRVCGGVGACCNWTGMCTDETEVDCVFNMGRSYKGEGTECLGDNDLDGWDDACGSPPHWGCCDPVGQCTEEPWLDCTFTFHEGEHCLGDSNNDGYDDLCIPPPDECLGDADGDDMIGINDVGWIVGLLEQAAPTYRIDQDDTLWDSNADVDGDGVITINDVGFLVGMLEVFGPPDYSQECP